MKPKVAAWALACAVLLAEPLARAGKMDFNNDGRADVFWRNSVTGENYFFPLNGTTILGSEGFVRTVADQSWQVAGIGDFDGNGTSDVLWRNASTGANYVYLMNGAAIQNEGYLPTVASQDWQVAAVADLTGDGKDDIVWRNLITGENYFYEMNGLARGPGEGYLRTVADQNWQIAGAADLDGDGKADLVWRNASTGDNYAFFMNGAAISNEGYLRAVASQDWQIAGVRNFNGDGFADILWRNRVTGENYVFFMNGLSVANEGYVRSVADLDWAIAGVADYNGDGRADILWRNVLSGENYLFLMDGTSVADEGYLRSVTDSAWNPVGEPSPGKYGWQYNSSFVAAESPLSDGGKWFRMADAHWTDVVTENGVAHGTNGAPGGQDFDDSYAYLKDFTGTDVEIEGTVLRDAGLNTAVTHEIEFLFRVTEGAGTVQLYEVLFSHEGFVQIFRWDHKGMEYFFTQIGNSAVKGSSLITGDRIRARLAGSNFTVWINDVQLLTASDATYTTGKPGIGFFTVTNGNSAHLALQDVRVRRIGN